MDRREKHKLYMRQWRKTHPEYYEYMKCWRQRYHNEIIDYNRQWCHIHPELRSEQKKRWRQRHKDEIKEHRRQYYQTHKKEIRKKNKQFYWIHCKQLRKANKQWKKEHPEYMRIWFQSENGKLCVAKYNARRKALGFIPINGSFEGSIWHHLTDELVVAIPKEVHLKCLAGTNVSEHRQRVLRYYDNNILNMLNREYLQSIGGVE